MFELLIEGSTVFLFISSNFLHAKFVEEMKLIRSHIPTGSYEHEAPCDPLIT